MSGRIGGTVEQMQTMGAKFNNEVAELESLVSRISSQLASTDWEGGAAQRFRAQWEGEFKSTFNQVAQGLRECAAEVQNRANALTQAGG
ncbi:MAG TPA: WXG100 family type VII secretion target [Solirubrobacteraceae bacterium]|nr:WXG100 family type VII secretion target [Solirubrobacteraceae bacterium]